MLHPPITLLNTGLIDRAADFLYYMDGASPHVARLVEAVDAERLAILRAFSLPGLPLAEWFRRVYTATGPDLYSIIAATDAYRTIAGPTSMNTRLLLEDVPTGLVPYCSLGKMAGVETPTMRAIVDTCCAVYGIDFWETGRTLTRMGLDNLDREQLLSRLGPV